MISEGHHAYTCCLLLVIQWSLSTRDKLGMSPLSPVEGLLSSSHTITMGSGNFGDFNLSFVQRLFSNLSFVQRLSSFQRVYYPEVPLYLGTH